MPSGGAAIDDGMIQSNALLAGRYRLDRRIDRDSGGMGSVWAATVRRGARHVAVKVPHHSLLTADPAYASRFEVEARLAERLPSARIVRVCDWGTHAGIPFLVMEY